MKMFRGPARGGRPLRMSVRRPSVTSAVRSSVKSPSKDRAL